jgi:hypothetical protein
MPKGVKENKSALINHQGIIRTFTFGRSPACAGACLRHIALYGSVVSLLGGLHLIPCWRSGILYKPLISVLITTLDGVFGIEEIVRFPPLNMSSC